MTRVYLYKRHHPLLAATKQRLETDNDGVALGYLLDDYLVKCVQVEQADKVVRVPLSVALWVVAMLACQSAQAEQIKALCRAILEESP